MGILSFGMSSTNDVTRVLVSPDSPVQDVPTSAILVSEVLFHREALARALGEYRDIVIARAVGDLHTALALTEEVKPDVLIVDSPSHALAQALAAHRVDCGVLLVGTAGGCRRQLESRGAMFVGATSSVEEVHIALRSVKRPTARLAANLREPPTPGADLTLTRRQWEVSRLVAGGYSNKEIANACGISLATVKNHVHCILAKLHCQRRTQIARAAREEP